MIALACGGLVCQVTGVLRLEVGNTSSEGQVMLILSVHFHVHLYVCVSVFSYLFICIYLSIYQFVYLFIYLFINLFT